MKLKKLTAILMTSVFAAGMLAGCGGGGNSEGSTGTSSAGEDGGIREYTAFFAVPGTEINDDNVVQQKIAEITGAKVKETWLTGQTASEAVGTMIAGGEYPDIIDGSDGRQQLIDAGALIPLEDYLESGDYPNLTNFWSEQDWEKVRQDDGHIYIIPQFGNPYEKDMATQPAEAFWIQTRVLEWAGYPEVKTLDQYFQLLEDYNAANPTMEDGTPNIPYTILCDDWRYFCLENPPQFLAGYPNDGSVIVDPETETIVDYNTTDTAVRYFQKLNEEYKKGIIDPECFTQSYDEYIAKLSTGRVLGMVDQQWQFGQVYDTMKQQGLDAQGCNYVPLAIGIDEDTPNQWRTTGKMIDPSNGVGITVSCEDVEGVLQFLNDLLSPEVRILRGWGVEGVDYEVGDDGLYYRTEEQNAQAADTAYKASEFCSYSYLPNYTGMLDDKLNAANPGEQPSMFEQTLPSDVQRCLEAYGCQTYAEMLGEGTPQPGPWYAMYTYSNSMTTATPGGTAWTKMGECKHEWLPKVVMADDFEQGWEEYMEAYNACNPQDFLDEMQEELDRRIEEAAKYAE